MSLHASTTTLTDLPYVHALKSYTHLAQQISCKKISDQVFCDRTVGLNGVIEMIKDEDHDDSVIVFDLSKVEEKIQDWNHFLPNVTPFYAVKANDDPAIVAMLGAHGTGFDCASMSEIKLAMEVGNAPPEKIVYANPCKSRSNLGYAKKMGVKKMTFDCPAELEKIKDCFPEAEVILRVKVDDSGALCQLGQKFGAQALDCGSLMQKCLDLELNLIGLSFHVGSGQSDPKAFNKALKLVKRIYDEALEKFNFDFKFLDIGGGFSGYDGDDMENRFSFIAPNIHDQVQKYFPECQVIAEPGRYFCSACCTLITKVLSKKEIIVEGRTTYAYFINDGVYGSFNNIIYDHAEPKPNFNWDYVDMTEESLYPTTIYGPTCDSIDVILRDFPMPELDIDELFFWSNMGAYTCAAACSFNGFSLAKKMYMYDDKLIKL